MGGSVVDSCNVIEVEDELPDSFVVVGVWDGGFYSLGCVSHTINISAFYNLSRRE